MELDIKTKQQLTDLLANPTTVSDAHINLLNDLVSAYPYYQPLHLLLAKASRNTTNYEHLLATASLYNGGSLVHQLIFNPETLNQEIDFAREIKVSDEQETFDEIAEVDSAAFASAIESIVSSDFFAFEQNFNSEQVTNDTLIVTQPEEYNQEAEAQSTLSKYDDDKLPYTFLWWLAKTRKEHEQIFQPYVSPKQPSLNQQGELEHQFVEHIFHLQTPFNIADEARKGPINLQNKPKGIEIIDSFIKNDPQIKAPKAEQINTENKAKKSAEDNYDLVSETLAAIYIEQMLYHKAIDTYEKLSLKFPEKSRYFADLIQSLEKKI
ncbi:MAG: hypothetical protein H7202_10225 [Pedobacter sp.]|nr:hypothetical protein [Pedobacter sp.]